MLRRLTVIAATLATLATAACANPTSPKDCGGGVMNGSCL
jgi:hypothetical protein